MRCNQCNPTCSPRTKCHESHVRPVPQTYRPDSLYRERSSRWQRRPRFPPIYGIWPSPASRNAPSPAPMSTRTAQVPFADTRSLSRPRWNRRASCPPFSQSFRQLPVPRDLRLRPMFAAVTVCEKSEYRFRRFHGRVSDERVVLVIDEIEVPIPLRDMCRALADRAARFQVAVMEPPRISHRHTPSGSHQPCLIQLNRYSSAISLFSSPRPLRFHKQRRFPCNESFFYV